MSRPDPEPTPKLGTKTAYHVLQEVTESGAKVYVPFAANVQAANGNAAIRAVANVAGVYVAVPSGRFNPTTVSVETQTVIKLA